MAFRADEAAQNGFEEVKRYLIPRDLQGNDRIYMENTLDDLVIELGPIISAYPSWHPLVSCIDSKYPQVWPTNDQSGYKGLDHTKCFVNGFITCPYGNGQDVLDSVYALPPNPVATITAERLDTKFYHETATAILVKCNWDKPISSLDNNMIPTSLAIPLLLEEELPYWRHSEVAETWESMRPYFLGRPHGSRSSLFVNQETGQAIKKVWNALIYTGMFGPIKV